MTCIVAIEQEGTIYLGGDSAASEPATLALRILHEPKVFRNGEMIMGCCSSLRIQQLMQHSLVLPARTEYQDDLEYLVTDFIDAVRAVQRDKGVQKKENEFEEHDAQFLLGYRGNIYYVEDDYQVYRTNEPWAAVGSGSDLALGALYALKGSKCTPEEKIQIALEAAESYNAGVRRPFYVLKLEPEKE